MLILLTAGGFSRFLSSRPVWLRTQRYAMGAVLGVLALNIAIDSFREVPTGRA